MANEALYYGTGRRKNATARVRLVPGTGKVTVNGRDAADYFGRQALVDMAFAPLKVTSTSSPTSLAAASPARLALFAMAFPALCWVPASIAPSSRRLASSRATHVWSSVRSTV